MRLESANEVRDVLSQALLGPAVEIRHPGPVTVTGAGSLEVTAFGRGPADVVAREVMSDLPDEAVEVAAPVGAPMQTSVFTFGPAARVDYWDRLRSTDLLTDRRTRSLVDRLDPASLASAVAVGLRRRKRGFVPTVRFERRSASSRDLADALVEALRGEIDVRFVGKVERLSAPSGGGMAATEKVRPIRPGCSISNLHETAGTLGAIVVTADKRFALTNAHVIGAGKMPRDGRTILQPGRLDGGNLSHAVGSLYGTIAPAPGQPNLFDAAYGLIDDATPAENTLLGLSRALGPLRTEPEPTGLAVSKVGRSSGLTQGTVTGFNIEALVWYDRTQIRFVNQIEITGDPGRFSTNGDSGSVVWSTDDAAAVGLLFAGSPGVSYASPLAPVLQAIGGTLA